MMKNKSSSPSSPERRNFLSKLWIGLGLVALLECIAGGASFFVSGRKNRSDKALMKNIEAGLVSDFMPGTVTFVRAGNCYLSRLDDGGFLAISRKCTHLGCAVPWVAERKQFECPCHASTFDVTGNVIQSPAPRPLDVYPITIEHDRVLIDVSRPKRRSGFAAEQLIYAQELG